MLKFRDWMNEKEGKETKESEYQAFFKKKLEKFGVKSASELSGDDKKKFFDEVDAEWKSEDEKEDGVEEKKDCNESIPKITVEESELKKIFRGFIKLSSGNVLVLEGADLSELEKFKKAQKCNNLIIGGSSDKNEILVMTN